MQDLLLMAPAEVSLTTELNKGTLYYSHVRSSLGLHMPVEAAKLNKALRHRCYN
jgi:hypothetical protein